jgi:THO complex subunit 2
MDLLINCAIIKEAIFNIKINGFKIKNFFDQRKFNLQREENEGYAKLIIEITQANLNPQNWQTVILNISQLVGFFSLDPTRVLDLILTAFECNLSNLTYLKLITDFGSQETITQLIGFKIMTLNVNES